MVKSMVSGSDFPLNQSIVSSNCFHAVSTEKNGICWGKVRHCPGAPWCRTRCLRKSWFSVLVFVIKLVATPQKLLIKSIIYKCIEHIKKTSSINIIYNCVQTSKTSSTNVLNMYWNQNPPKTPPKKTWLFLVVVASTKTTQPQDEVIAELDEDMSFRVLGCLGHARKDGYGGYGKLWNAMDQ